MSKIRYQAHISNVGWQPEVEDGQVAGTVGENKALEAFRITGIEVDAGDEVGIAAHAHVQDLGWSDATPIGNDVGSTGLGKHLEAVKIGLTGRDRDKYEIWYRLNVNGLGFLEWSTDGAVNGTEGGNVPAESIQIYLCKKADHFYPKIDTDIEYKNLTPPPAPTPAPQPEVDRRALALNLAASYVGYVTGTSDDSIFGRRYAGVNAGSWCCFSVRSICEDCGITFPATGYVPDVEDWARDNGRWTTSIDTSRLQAIIYDFNGNGTGDHIGLVESAISGGAIALEGNTSGPNGEPIGYWRKRRMSGIRGYVNLT